ncbi:MAG TPA: LpqB family beta-propeller domain-containing protein, partial [Tessaracoccus flavescens]|nr:LpqB family beta-propeller domain-containing protein [Tessaracoccus flavescens]
SVESEIPDGVTLGQGGATTDSAGVVTVDFSGLSPLMNDDARRRLGAQLMWSLTAVPRVAGLVVTSNGLPFSLPGANANGVLELSGLQGYQVLSRVSTSDLFGIRYGIAGRLAGPSVFERLPGVARALGDLAVSIDGTTAALLDETRSQLSIGPIAGDIAPVDTGLINMSTPQFALGSVWVLGDDAEGKQHLFTIDRNRNVHSVRLDVGVNQRVRAFAVSPTQSRVALILENQEGTRLAMSSILTGGGALGETHVLPVSALNGALLTDFNAVTWYAETSVAVVATGGTGSRSVFTVQLDGSLLEEIGPIFGEIEELAGMSRLGGGSLAVRTDTGLVWRYEARTRWTRVAENITAIAFAA